MKYLWLVGLLCQASWAGQLNLEYSQFYSHLKKIDKTELAALQFSFGFKQVGSTELCHIQHAEVITQKVTLPVEITAEQRFTLPIEKALKLADAVVSIELQELPNQCDLSVQLETKAEFLKQQYSQSELSEINQQFKQFFSDMGGLFSFMMPSSAGLKLWFAQTPAGPSAIKGMTHSGSQLIVSENWFEQAEEDLILAQKPLRITALMDR